MMMEIATCTNCIRLVLQKTLTGKVLHTYEYREDGTERLLIFPTNTAENGNSDMCVVNPVGGYTGELIVLQRDGQMRDTYKGKGDSKLDPRDVACDSERRIILLNWNKCIHILSPDVTFLICLLSDYTTSMTLYQGSLWIGFIKGIVKVYTYIKCNSLKFNVYYIIFNCGYSDCKYLYWKRKGKRVESVTSATNFQQL